MRFLAGGLFVLLVLWGCRSATTPTVTTPPAATVSQTFTPASGSWTHDTTSGAYWITTATTDLTSIRSLNLSLTLPATGSVRYLYTNTDTDPGDTATTYASVSASRRLEPNLPTVKVSPSSARSLSAAVYQAPIPTLHSTLSFIDVLNSTATTTRTVATTLQKQVTGGTETLNIWVANDLWTTAGYSSATVGKVSQTMVDQLAAKFLDGTSNNLYTWETGLLGAEWDDSDANTASYIHTQKQIDIFVVDLNPGVDRTAGGGLYYGYFWSGNLYPVASESLSNQRELFAVDGIALGTGSTTTSWALSDPNPLDIVSTLSHEFQHMIRFYQKDVVHGVSETNAWTNEMGSMLVEDLLSKQLSTVGPRGYTGSNLTGSGSPPDTSSRIAWFLANRPTTALTGWSSNATASLAHYGTAYAFGAWLVRNYGGAVLLKAMVQSADAGNEMVANAVNAVNSGASETFASLVQKWGLAQFLGRSTTAPYAYSAIGGDFLSDPVFSLGSIQLANYVTTWPALEASTTPSVASGQTAFVNEGSGVLNQAWSHTVYLPAHIALTVVVQP